MYAYKTSIVHYQCEYCGAEFSSNEQCLEHEKICDKKIVNELIKRIHYKQCKCCSTCKYSNYVEQSCNITLSLMCSKHKELNPIESLSVCDDYKDFYEIIE